MCYATTRSFASAHSTVHLVPTALISKIGRFFLNNKVDSLEIFLLLLAQLNIMLLNSLYITSELPILKLSDALPVSNFQFRKFRILFLHGPALSPQGFAPEVPDCSLFP